MYSGNRKLGLVYGLPDMGPLFSTFNIIDSGLNQVSGSGTKSVQRTGELNILLQLSTSQIAQIEWPKPCEYFGGQILSSDFPTSFKIQSAIISPVVYNIYNDLSNLNNTGILYSGRIYDNEYLFRYISGLDVGNGITGKVGAIFDRNNAILANTFSITNPSTSVVGSSGRFEFVRANEGFNYEVQYTRNLNSGWLFTGITLQASSNQTNVPSGFTRVEYLLPLTELAGGSLFFRVKIQKIEYLEIGRYTIVNTTGMNTLNISIKDAKNNSYIEYRITPSGAINGVLEQFDGGGCNN